MYEDQVDYLANERLYFLRNLALGARRHYQADSLAVGNFRYRQCSR